MAQSSKTKTETLRAKRAAMGLVRVEVWVYKDDRAALIEFANKLLAKTELTDGRRREND
jgi:hypothetical protein